MTKPYYRNSTHKAGRYKLTELIQERLEIFLLPMDQMPIHGRGRCAVGQTLTWIWFSSPQYEHSLLSVKFVARVQKKKKRKGESQRKKIAFSAPRGTLGVTLIRRRAPLVKRSERSSSGASTSIFFTNFFLLARRTSPKRRDWSQSTL